MRALLLLAAVACLASQVWFAVDTAGTAGQVLEAAERIHALGDEQASELALSVPTDLYPFSMAAFSARMALAQLEQGLSDRALDVFGLPARDPLTVARDEGLAAPWLGPLGVLVLAALLLVYGLLAPRSRVRILSLLLLLGLGMAAALSQGWVSMPAPASSDGWDAVIASQAEAVAFAAFPWLALAGLTLATLLVLLPRRAAD
jgi:hypothetical protein